MKIQTKGSIAVVIIIAVMVGIFIPVALGQADGATAKVSRPEPAPAKQIYGVQCRLRPDRDEWQISEIPKFKAYVSGPGNSDLWLATIVHKGCQLQVDRQWYRYINPEWTGGMIGRTQSDWIAKAGGFLSISLDKEHWVTLHDSKPLILVSGEHTISLGWAGYKEDPTGKSDHEDNPILLLSEPVEIQILEPKVTAPEVAPGDERHWQVMELFGTFVQKEPLTEAEQKLGIKTDLRLFHYWRPKFTWEDIPVLLELARNEELLNGMPSLAVSSYIGRHCRQGMIALWFIEGLRRQHISTTREKQLGEKLHPASYRLPLNPICVKEDMELSECEQSLEIHRIVLQVYLQWWLMVESLPAGQAAAFYPLDMTALQWFGAPDRWPEEPLEIYERFSSDGTAAKRTIRHLQKIEGTYDYEPGKILQTVYYTLRKPVEPPYTTDMLKIRKIVLRYYDSQGKEIRTVDIVPETGRQGV